MVNKNAEHSFNIGYLFLKKLCYELKLDKIANKAKKKYKFEYDLNDIISSLIYARILSLSSKVASFNFAKTLIEQPKYELQDLYRSLSVIANESFNMQEEIYRNSNYAHSRNTKVIDYDCTNYYFEIEESDSLRKYGKSKEHRSNLIVIMGMFMD